MRLTKRWKRLDWVAWVLDWESKCKSERWAGWVNPPKSFPLSTLSLEPFWLFWLFLVLGAGWLAQSRSKLGGTLFSTSSCLTTFLGGDKAISGSSSEPSIKMQDTLLIVSTICLESAKNVRISYIFCALVKKSELLIKIIKPNWRKCKNSGLRCCSPMNVLVYKKH